MTCNQNKRNQVSLITTVVLVLIAIIAVSIIGTFVVNLVRENIRQTEITSQAGTGRIDKARVLPSDSGYNLEIVVVRDFGNQKWDKIKILLKNETTNESITQDVSLGLFESRTITIPITITKLMGAGIIPIIQVDGVYKEYLMVSYTEDISDKILTDPNAVDCTNRDGDYDGYNNTFGCGPLDCDDGDASVWMNRGGYVDGDRDGFGTGISTTICSGGSLPIGYSEVGGDCNDTNINIYPGALELIDGKDNNCNGMGDELYYGIIAYYPFDGDATDISIGSRHNGTLKNGVVCDTPGVSSFTDKSCTLDGYNDYISVMTNLEDFKMADKTISFWIKAHTPPFSSYPTYNYSYSYVLYSSLQNYFIRTHAYDPRHPTTSAGRNITYFNYYNNITGACEAVRNELADISPYRFYYDRWIFVTYTQQLSAGNLVNNSIYYDGVLVPVVNITGASYTNGINVSATPTIFYIGSSKACITYLPCSSGYTYSLNGSLDNLRIYNRTLSSSEINCMYKLDTTGSC